MEVRAHTDPDGFRAAIDTWYSADPVRHTLALSVMARFLDDPAISAVMLTVHDAGGGLAGAALRTPPWPLIISGLPAGAHPPVAAALVDLDPELPGVTGPRELAESFAAAWAGRTGAGLDEALASRLYELDELHPPTVPGGRRFATEADLPLLLRWRLEFQAEAIGHTRGVGQVGEQLRRGLAGGDGLLLWERDGQDVSMASANLPVAGMSRVMSVYTPPELRGHGYGSAVTAAASRWARDAGAKHVLLFTDLANPTSNSIYRKIGYREVFDTCEIEFTPAP
ncbi:GNAT family N-acetyltransferase [Actinophytocola sp.]|uniref:GNAT family N-acetyltransferase n=1 Tax=Actinophytocola sp. TaxID=1872138 RepID=UPI003D6A20EF